MKTRQIITILACALVLCSCREVVLNEYENMPEVSAAILGMTTDKAVDYLQKKGYVCYTVKESTNGEVTFSKDPSTSSFNENAPIILSFGTFKTDTVKYVVGHQEKETAKAALELYRKWTRYTFNEIIPNPYHWSARIWANKEDHSYSQGKLVSEELALIKDQYAKGEISEQDYQNMLAQFSNDRKAFLNDLSTLENIEDVGEEYIQFDLKDVQTNPNVPKLIEISLDDEELDFQIANFIPNLEPQI